MHGEHVAVEEAAVAEDLAALGAGVVCLPVTHQVAVQLLPAPHVALLAQVAHVLALLQQRKNPIHSPCCRAGGAFY